MRNIKKFLSLLLALAMLISLFPAALAAEAEEENSGTTAWDGSVDFSWYDADAAQLDISTPAQWAGLAWIVSGQIDNFAAKAEAAGISITGAEYIPAATDTFAGKTIYLTADLDMGGTVTLDNAGNQVWNGPLYMPIGGAYKLNDNSSATAFTGSFAGSFDGQGHKIYNINAAYTNNASSVGLFGAVSGTVSIKNVWVEGSFNGGTVGKSSGGIVANAKNCSNLTIENCVNAADVTGTAFASTNGAGGVGGIVGHGSGIGWLINNCANYGTITGNSLTGGIVGAAGEGETVTNCLNMGTVVNASDAEKAGIANIRNLTNVTGYSNNYYAGTVGVMQNTTDYTASATGCIALTDDETDVTLEGEKLVAALNTDNADAWGMDEVNRVVPAGFALSSSVASGDCGDSLTWTLTGDETDGYTLTIEGSGAMTAFTNETYVPWHDYAANITAVSLPEGLTSIGKHAFRDCARLAEIAILEGVTSIGDRAFQGCTALTALPLPSTLTSIGQFAILGSAVTELVIPDGMTALGNFAFSGASALQTITIPKSVTSVGIGTFGSCTSLQKVIYIGTEAEWNSITINANDNSALTSATIIYDPLPVASGVCGDTSSGGDGSNLTWSLIGDDTDGYALTIEGSGAMKNYDNASNPTPWADYRAKITSVTLPEGLTNIGNCAFLYFAITEITIPSTVTQVGASAFAQCKGLNAVEIPEGVTQLGGSAFSYCTSLEKAVLPSTLTTVDFSAFYNCTALTQVNIPESLTAITPSMFQKCTALETITIPASIKYINADAFNGCTALKTVYYLGLQEQWNAITIGSNNDALTSATLYTTDLVLPPVINTQPEGASYAVNAESVAALTVVAAAQDDGVLSYQWYSNTIESNENGTLIDGATNASYTPVVSEEATTYYYCVVTSTLDGNTASTVSAAAKVIVAGTGVAVIDAGAYGVLSWKLTEDGVLTISGEGAMTNGADASSYPWNTYRNQISKVVVEAGVTSIGAYAFQMYMSALTSVEIGEGCTSIGQNAFMMCSKLATVTLPKSLTTVAENGFANTGLTDVYYGGVASDWSAVSIGSNNSWLTNAIVHFSDGTVSKEAYTITTNGAKSATYYVDGKSNVYVINAGQTVTVQRINVDSTLLITKVSYVYDGYVGDPIEIAVGTTFEMPAGNVTVTVETTEKPALPVLALEEGEKYLWEQNKSGTYEDNSPVVITFDDVPLWRERITSIMYKGKTMYDYKLEPGKLTIVPGTTYYVSNSVNCYDMFTTVGNHYIAFSSNGFDTIGIQVPITYETWPAITLKADTTGLSGTEDITITFTDDARWRGVISSVKVNGTAVEGYTLSSGKLTIPASCFDGKDEYEIVVTADDYYDSTVTQIIYGVSKSEAVTIGTAEQLLAFAKDVNNGDYYTGTSVTLTADIDLSGLESWTRIGTNSALPFKGTFDGQGHTVTLYCSGDTTVSSALIGYAEGAVIKNVVTDAKGVACGAALAASAKSCRIENCVNYADVVGTQTCAGLVGTCLYDSSVTGVAEAECGLFDCINYGSVSCLYQGTNEVKPNGSAAGVCRNAVRMVRCANLGDITGGDISSFNTCYALGYATEVISCYNAGKLTTGNYYHSAAIAGVTVTDCYNTGAVVYDPRGGGEQSMVNHIDGIYGTTVTNCYNVGALSNTVTNEKVTVDMQEIYATTKTNCYTSADSITVDGLNAERTGDEAAWKADVNGINSGYPLLSWQAEDWGDQTHAVTFLVTGAENYTVTVTSGEETCTPEEDGSYLLTGGVYTYAVSADGCVTEKGTFSVTIREVEVSVELKPATQVTFKVTPASAEFELTLDDASITPDKSENGEYTYILYTGKTYTYTANAAGYNSTLREYTVPASAATVDVTLTVSDYVTITDVIYGSGNEGEAHTIIKGGEYAIGEGATGIITINTTDAVTLVGTGTANSSMYEYLYIDCVQAGTNLTLKDVYIRNTTGDSATTNMIDFTGKDNVLNFKGINILDYDGNASGYAMIHVNQDTELTVTGGVAYIYKREQGAGIGGNGGASGNAGQEPETNGNITIKDATLFMKASKQGALIGAGAVVGTARDPGTITIENSVLNMIAIARGAAIGGSAGSSGASKGADVTIKNSTVNINVDWTGSAIGGGGYIDGNDSDGGTLTVVNSSIRTYLDWNALDPNGDGDTSDSNWTGITEPGVNNNAAITADVYMSDGETPAYLLILDTSYATANKTGDAYIVMIGDEVIYSGGLHEYSYVNEGLHKESQISINYTVDNWKSMTEPNLYLYVTGEDHELTVNGQVYNAKWDESTGTFTVTKDSGEDTPITPTISNNTGTTPAAAITAPEGGWVKGENTFTVSANVACVVLVKDAEGNYTKLTASATDVDNAYSFTGTLAADSEIIVAVKGDVDGNGEVNILDRLAIARSLYTDKTSETYAELSELGALVGDVDGSGEVNILDRLAIARSLYTDKTSETYAELGWE